MFKILSDDGMKMVEFAREIEVDEDGEYSEFNKFAGNGKYNVYLQSTCVFTTNDLNEAVNIMYAIERRHHEYVEKGYKDELIKVSELKEEILRQNNNEYDQLIHGTFEHLGEVDA